MLSEKISVLHRPDGMRRRQLEKKLAQDYSARLFHLSNPENIPYLAPEVLQTHLDEIYSYEILKNLLDTEVLDVVALHESIQPAIDSEKAERVFWEYVHIIHNYIVFGHSGDEFRRKPLPTVED